DHDYYSLAHREGATCVVALPALLAALGTAPLFARLNAVLPERFLTFLTLPLAKADGPHRAAHRWSQRRGPARADGALAFGGHGGRTAALASTVQATANRARAGGSKPRWGHGGTPAAYDGPAATTYLPPYLHPKKALFEIQTK